MLNLLGAGTTISYPQCVAAGVNPAQAWVAIHASTHNGPIYYASAFRAVHGSFFALYNEYHSSHFFAGMALWIGLLIHVVGVEFYVGVDKLCIPSLNNDGPSRFIRQRPQIRSDLPMRWRLLNSRRRLGLQRRIDVEYRL